MFIFLQHWRVSVHFIISAYHNRYVPDHMCVTVTVTREMTVAMEASGCSLGLTKVAATNTSKIGKDTLKVDFHSKSNI